MQPLNVGAPGQQLMQGAGPEMTNAVQKMQNMTAVKVQQKRRLLEAVSCWEQQNRYMISDQNDQAKQLYFVQEGSKWWERMCLPSDCKPWRMDFHNLPQGGLQDGTDGTSHPAFLHIERPCSLTCCCINRPEAIITEVPSGRVLGTLRDPFAFCNLTFQVFDSTGAETLKSSTCCCTKGLICKCPGCIVDFPINDARDGRDVATLRKTWMWGDHCPMCFKDWDNYAVHFGEASNPDYKLLLIALSTFVQMRYFDSRNDS